jgi:nicotinamidase-related amidase
MAIKTTYSMLTPADCALALIDFQPAMFSGVHSHDRTTVRDHTVNK